MEETLKEFVHFVQSARGFDALQKIKLIVFASGFKRAAFVRLRIGPNNLGDKHHFEKHLMACGILYKVSKPKTVEEITSVEGNCVIWRPNGLWFGYDIFFDKETENQFKKYQLLLRAGQHSVADELGALLYGYPFCCQKQYSKEHDVNYIKRNYTSFEFFKKIHDIDFLFPFIFHTPCSLKCKHTAIMNERHKAVVKRFASCFYVEFSKKEEFDVEVIVDADADVFNDFGRSIWSEKDGHNFSLITRKPICGKYYMLSYLTKRNLSRGSVYIANVITKYDVPVIKLGKKLLQFKYMHHQRRFYIP